MKEQDYINVKELGTITAAINVLRDICPENSKIINVPEFRAIMKSLSEWQAEYFKRINTTP